MQPPRVAPASPGPLTAPDPSSGLAGAVVDGWHQGVTDQSATDDPHQALSSTLEMSQRSLRWWYADTIFYLRGPDEFIQEGIMAGISTAFGAVALAGAFSLGGVASASADPQVIQSLPASWSQCDPGEFCMWDRINASGDVYFGLPQNDDLRPYDWNDKADSVANMTSRNICVFWDINFGGNYVRIPPNGRVNLPVSWRNKVSSYQQLPSGISNCRWD